MALTPFATTFNASMSSPESVSSRIASVGSSTASWKISLRFFSPPEKPSFTDRFSSVSSISSLFIRSRTSAMKSIASSSSSPWYFLMAFTAALRKYMLFTPGISTGY